MIHYYGLYARYQAKKLKKMVEDLARSFNQRGWEKEQAIPSDIVYDFTKGKNSHPGGETLFVCTNCGTPMKPKEKE